MGNVSAKYTITKRRLVLRSASHRATWWIGRNCKKSVPLVFVVGYPKSGTTWVTQLVADYLRLPYPQFSLLPIGCPAVVHGHDLVSPRDPRGVYSIRDGRDALVSFFFHMLRRVPEGERPTLTRVQRATLPGLVNKDDAAKVLPRFIERQMTHPTSSRVNWGRHVASYLECRRSDWAMLRYEDLLSDGQRALSAAMATITDTAVDDERVAIALDRYSFARLSGRSKGQENRNSYLRKGEAGDWKNHFTREIAEIFDRACGDSLIGAGYEADRSWVSACPAVIESKIAEPVGAGGSR